MLLSAFNMMTYDLSVNNHVWDCAACIFGLCFSSSFYRTETFCPNNNFTSDVDIIPEPRNAHYHVGRTGIKYRDCLYLCLK